MHVFAYIHLQNNFQNKTNDYIKLSKIISKSDVIV